MSPIYRYGLAMLAASEVSILNNKFKEYIRDKGVPAITTGDVIHKAFNEFITGLEKRYEPASIEKHILADDFVQKGVDNMLINMMHSGLKAYQGGAYSAINKFNSMDEVSTGNLLKEIDEFVYDYNKTAIDGALELVPIKVL